MTDPELPHADLRDVLVLSGSPIAGQAQLFMRKFPDLMAAFRAARIWVVLFSTSWVSDDATRRAYGVGPFVEDDEDCPVDCTLAFRVGLARAARVPVDGVPLYVATAWAHRYESALRDLDSARCPIISTLKPPHGIFFGTVLAYDDGSVFATPDDRRSVADYDSALSVVLERFKEIAAQPE